MSFIDAKIKKIPHLYKWRIKLFILVGSLYKI